MKQFIAKFKRSVRISEAPADPTTSDAAPKLVTIGSDVGHTEAEPQSTPSPKAKQQNCDSRLESLLPEVRRQLLSILDLRGLKLLVRASPTFHQQYLVDRKYLLCRSLEETLGSVAIDAYAVHKCTAQAGDTKQNTPWVPNSYSEQTSRRYLSLADKLTLDEAIRMAVFYFHSVKPITEYYARWSLDNLANEAGKDSHNHQQEVTLTRTETMRLIRATYRFQLLCQLVEPANKAMRLSRQETVLDFLGVLEPWEIEELFSFYQFARDVYDRILTDIRWDLHPDNPRFDDQGRPPTPEGAFDLDISTDRSNYLEGITLRGLSLLHTVLFKIKDHKHLVSTMQQHITSSYIPFNALEGVLGETQQALRRRNHPSERDRMQEQRTPYPFRGDSEPDAPPLAWTIMWGNTYSNLYGWYIPEEMRRWGYVFWDAATLEGMGGRRVLNRQWEEYWDNDPRDDLL
ncbi:hypothetical protein QBC33DRAFT_502392 [Phialemonium atrogriseum]|uniref:Uncharacterized protein n=1 Tax=Phialemonium atrogriseum TaxID=1093897 RepID=A0AAJ0BNP3_9PEZI|nr:uncharacterized protein QBC33DRAFT_502392 [Phialemonium atrogriseum]KAK1761660.1 hypothetical protein QBC33DRAFT_502392 [Phialemonium atrogriseum]